MVGKGTAVVSSTGRHPLLLYDDRLAVLHPAAVAAIVIDAIQIIAIMIIVVIAIAAAVVVAIALAAAAIVSDAAAVLGPDRAVEAIIAAAGGEEEEGEVARAAVEVDPTIMIVAEAAVGVAVVTVRNPEAGVEVPAAAVGSVAVMGTVILLVEIENVILGILVVVAVIGDQPSGVHQLIITEAATIVTTVHPPPDTLVMDHPHLLTMAFTGTSLLPMVEVDEEGGVAEAEDKITVATTALPVYPYSSETSHPTLIPKTSKLPLAASAKYEMCISPVIFTVNNPRDLHLLSMQLLKWQGRHEKR